MPKESGPQRSGMNRRDFLKAAGAAGVALATGRKVETQAQNQEYLPLTNWIEKLTIQTDFEKINYPDTPKAITPEVESLIMALDNYQLAYTGGVTLESAAATGKNQNLSKPGSEKEITKAKQNAWSKLKNLDPSLHEYSDENFYKTLIFKVPNYLAQYGIFCPPAFIGFFNNDSQPPHFVVTEVAMHFLQIERVQHDETEQWGQKMKRDIVYIKGPFPANSALTSEKSINHAQNGLGNISMYEPGIASEFKGILVNVESLGSQVDKYPKGELTKILQKQLEGSNNLSDAISVAMVRVYERMKRNPTLDEFKAEVLVHETGHLFDILQKTYTKLGDLKVTSNVAEHERQVNNIYFHHEINALISQLRYAPDREFAFIRLLADSRQNLDNNPSTQIYHAWVLDHLIKLISENPESYGIKVFTGSPVSDFNQILSHIDALLGHADLFNSLCEKLIKFHNQNLTEDIVGENSSQLEGDVVVKQKSKDLSALSKLEIPAAAATVAGGVYVGLKKLAQRKAEVAKQNMSRDERRRAEREEKKKSKKLKK